MLVRERNLCTINSLIELMGKSSGKLIVSDDRGWRTIRICDLQAAVGSTAVKLAEARISAGDRVGIVGGNDVNTVVADLACISLGAISVHMPFEDHAAINEILDRTGVGVVVSGKPTVETFNGRTVLDVQAGSAPTGGNPSFQFEPTDNVTLKFTSGSTGKPKIIGGSAQSVDDTLCGVHELFNHGEDDTILVFLPLHILQQRYWVYSAILHSCAVILCSPLEALAAMSELKPTVVMGVPGFYEELRLAWSLAEQGCTGDGMVGQGRPYGESLRYLWTGSAPANTSTINFFEDRGVPLYQGYGMNEAPLIAKNAPGRSRPGSVGKPLPNREILITEAEEIMVRHLYPTAKGYWDERDDSRDTFLQNGYVATGDLGRLDQDGYLYVTGRIKDLIVLTSGIKVQPAAIEQELLSQGVVEDCLVIGSGRPFASILAVLPAQVDPGAAIDRVSETALKLCPQLDFVWVQSVDRISDWSVDGGAYQKRKRSQLEQLHKDTIDKIYVDS